MTEESKESKERQSKRLNLSMVEELYDDIEALQFYLKKRSLNDTVLQVLIDRIEKIVASNDPWWADAKALVEAQKKFLYR